MEQATFKKILSDFGYKKDTIYKILQGRMTPTLQKAIMLHEEYKIPYEAWINIDEFVVKPTKKVYRDIPIPPSKMDNKG